MCLTDKDKNELGKSSAASLLRYFQRSDLLRDIDRCLEIRFYEEKPFILLIGENHTNQNHPLAQLVIIRHLLSRFKPSDITLSYELRHDLPERIIEIISEEADDPLMMNCVAACLEEAGGFAPFAHAIMLRTISNWGIACQFTDTSFEKNSLGNWVVSSLNDNCDPKNEICPQRPNGIILRNEFAYAQSRERIVARKPKIHIHIGGAIHVRGGSVSGLNMPYKGSLSDIYSNFDYDVMGVVLSNQEVNKSFDCPEDYNPQPNSFFCESQSTVWIPGSTHIRGIDEDGEAERVFVNSMMQHLFPDNVQDGKVVYSYARQKLAGSKHKIHEFFLGV